MKLPIAIAIFTLFASVAGGIFIFNIEKEITVQNVPPNISPKEEMNLPTAAIAFTTSTQIFKKEELMKQTEVFIEQEQAKLALIAEAQEKSNQAKGIYAGPARSINNFKTLLAETELNSLVMDVKEASGQSLYAHHKTLISELHAANNWAIARVVVFRDSSLVGGKPEWYLAASSTDAATTTPLWQDKAGQYWLDPDNEEVQNYIIEFSKKVIDYGFDELQFDYIRYPDDYKYVSGQEKIKAIGDFFSKLSKELRDYKPSIILSVDLFGYVATQFNSYGTGQRLIDAGKYFDYLSFMLYPSHFYGGFTVPADSNRQLSAAYFPYKDDNTTTTSHLVSANPYQVVLRSVLSSLDYLEFYGIQAKIRPWLQDFDIKADTGRGIFYDKEKVRLEIDAAEGAGSHGWLLWNPSYIYTEGTLASSTSPFDAPPN